jgi:hypothetical protein
MESRRTSNLLPRYELREVDPTGAGAFEEACMDELGMLSVQRRVQRDHTFGDRDVRADFEGDDNGKALCAGSAATRETLSLCAHLQRMSKTLPDGEADDVDGGRS